MAKITRLDYKEYKQLESALNPHGYFHEVREETVDGMTYRKTILLILGEREFRFVGPWKHAYHEATSGASGAIGGWPESLPGGAKLDD